MGQLQSRRVFGRKDNVTVMVAVFHVRTCQILVHVGYNTMMSVSLGYLSQCDGRMDSSSYPVVTELRSNLIFTPLN